MNAVRGWPASAWRRSGRTDTRQQVIGWAFYAATTAVEHVRVDHRRFHVSVAKEFLHGANALRHASLLRIARLSEQVSCKAMS